MPKVPYSDNVVAMRPKLPPPDPMSMMLAIGMMYQEGKLEQHYGPLEKMEELGTHNKPLEKMKTRGEEVDEALERQKQEDERVRY